MNNKSIQRMDASKRLVIGAGAGFFMLVAAPIPHSDSGLAGSDRSVSIKNQTPTLVVAQCCGKGKKP